MQPRPLRFANFLAFNVNPTYAAIGAEVERVLGISTSFEEGQTFEQFFHDEIDVGYVCGLPYGKLSRLEDAPFELLVAPVLVGARYAGQAVYFSDVIVHRDSPFQAFDDLQGCTFTYNESVSYSGYHVMTYHLAEQQRDWSFFASRIKSGAHMKSIATVVNCQADAAAIDSHALDAQFMLDPTLRDKIRIVEMIGPSPIPPVVVGRRVSAELKANLRRVYLDLHNNPALQPMLTAGCIERFRAVDDAYYDTIRARVDTTSIDFR